MLPRNESELPNLAAINEDSDYSFKFMTVQMKSAIGVSGLALPYSDVGHAVCHDRPKSRQQVRNNHGERPVLVHPQQVPK